MKCFVWQRLSPVTDHWHPEAGVLIIAPSLEDAILVLKDIAPDVEITTVDLEFECAPDTSPDIFIFPDAGCC